MKLILGVILLISLSIQLEKKDFSISFASEKEFQFPRYNISLGTEENSLVLSLYYPFILYDMSKGKSTYEETEKKVPVTPFLSSEGITASVADDSLIFTEEKGAKTTDKVSFLTVNKGIVGDDNKAVGYFGLAPLTSSAEFNEYLTLDLLKKKGIITNTIFSIGKIERRIDGSYKGLLTLGKKHTDFQTTKGKSVTCTDKSDYFWGCNFRRFSGNGATMNFDSKSKVVLITEDIYAFLDYDKYFATFEKLIPANSGCEKVEGNEYSYYSCNSWSTKEMPIKLNFKLDKDEFNLLLDIPDENDLNGKNRRHYEFTPAVRFVKGLNDVFIPMIWFKDFHVLFSKESTGKSSLVFHVDDEALIETVGEEVIDKSNYIMISKVAFIFLCISCGIVLIFLVLFIGYVRLTSKAKVRGIQANKGKKGTGSARAANFDSALLGTSSDSMPRRMKTSI